MIIDGKKIAEEIKKELGSKARGRDLSLAIIWVGEDLVSERYVERKKKMGLDLGIEVVVREYPVDVLEEDLAEEIARLNDDINVSGIIIQLPLPKEIDEQKIINLISPDKDVDALGAEARVLSPTIGAIKEILERNNVELAGKKVVVLGQGRLVGRPAAIWLTQEGAQVEIVDKDTKNRGEIIKSADIIISGVGQADLLTPDLIKEGVVLIDAGTSESGGQLVGDANPACAGKCSLFTPVPGGVGPLTVVMLFKNLLELNS